MITKEEGCIVREKKTEVITVRVTSETKRAIEQEAERREWSTSKMAEKILSTWAQQKSDRDISVNFQQNTIQTINIT